MQGLGCTGSGVEGLRLQGCRFSAIRFRVEDCRLRARALVKAKGTEGGFHMNAV